MRNGKLKSKQKIGFLIAGIIVLIVLFVSLITFITDWEWFSEMGYVSVFFTELLTKIKIGVPIFVLALILVKIYLALLKKKYFKEIASSEMVNMKKLNVISWILSIAMSIVLTVAVVPQIWYEYLQYNNGVDFNIVDPIFGLDVSFYIFKLDFLDKLNELAIFAIIALIVLTVIYYIVLLTMRTPDLYKERPQEEERYEEKDFSDTKLGKVLKGMGVETGDFKVNTPTPKKELDRGNFNQLMKIASNKLATLGAIFFIMVAIDYVLKQFQLMYAHNNVVYGAGFTDVNITLWKYRIIAVLSIISALLVVIYILKKKYKKLILIPICLIAVGIIGSGVGAVVQNFVVSPDELNKEYDYLANNIEYTQYAYGLDDVTIKSFAADNTLTSEDIKNNPETIDNIRINDFEPAKQFYNQTQAIRQYYTFNDVDVDRYMVNGEYTETFITAREIDENKISDTWLNRHLKYTHGYGVAMSRVDKVTASGQPEVLIGNIPPESTVSEIEITEPGIYFGESTNDYIIVGTDEAEFDYPDGEKNAYTKYEGTAGIKLNLINRLMFTIREGSLKILTSSNINNDSKIVINRNIEERVYKIMPYLTYEGDPYLVVCDGKLYWIMDAYTKSSNYPYSEPYSNLGDNYLRNSVKVVIDAYNGDVSFYIVDEEDPIAKTMQKIYPELFKSYSEMPDGLKDHLRYPEALFEIQASVYAKYHMNDIAVFYQSEDLWEIAYEIYNTDKVRTESNFYIAKLPGETSAEFYNSITFTPKSKQNMTALMVARCDGDNYGELILYQFPKSRTIYGAEQIEAQIDQNTEISKEFTLWTSAGTSYRRGNLFVIPIGTSLLYVEPVYLEAQNSSIPEVKRIIAVYDDQIAYGETLTECLETLFGDISTKDEPVIDEPVTPVEIDDRVEILIEKANTAYENAIKAQRAGNWADYGKYMDELESYLNALAK